MTNSTEDYLTIRFSVTQARALRKALMDYYSIRAKEDEKWEQGSEADHISKGFFVIYQELNKWID